MAKRNSQLDAANKRLALHGLAVNHNYGIPSGE